MIPENSVNLGAIGEQWNSFKDINDLVYLDINHGVGAGIIIDNKIVTGKTGAMGEISYLPVLKQYDYKKLKENKLELGLFESQVDAIGIVNTVKEKFKEHDKSKKYGFFKNINEINFDAICKYYNNDSDNFIKDLINNETIDTLAIGLASIISILDTELIIINGDILKLGNQFIEKLKTVIYNITPFKPKIVVSELKKDAHIIGAIKNGIDNLNNLLYNQFLSSFK